MKTITLQGTDEQFDSLSIAISSPFMPKEIKTRVYVASVDEMGETYWDDMTDEEFKEVADRNYDLEAFQEAFNDGDVNTFVDIVRVINEK